MKARVGDWLAAAAVIAYVAVLFLLAGVLATNLGWVS